MVTPSLSQSHRPPGQVWNHNISLTGLSPRALQLATVANCFAFGDCRHVLLSLNNPNKE